MKYLKKLLINKELNLSDLKNIEIKEIKIRPEEIKKLDDKSMINFINFLKLYKINNVNIGNEEEILKSITVMISKYKLTPRDKVYIKSQIEDNPTLMNIFKNII